jgi:hypothetical protein
VAASGQNSRAPEGRKRLALGGWGTLARVAVGLLSIYLALFWRDPEWTDAALGLVVMPAVVVAGVLLWTRRRPAPIRATGPIGHLVNLAVLIPLFSLPATAGASFLFYGASMLVAAARRTGGCEVTAISNALLKRDDDVGCPLFAPLDFADARLRRGRPRLTGPEGPAAMTEGARR